MPTDAPKNITWRFQTPDVVEIVYDAPPEHTRNGQITKYEIQFWKGADPNKKKLRQTTDQKTVFANLDDNTEYKFSVRANTRKGYGPWSTQQSFRTDRNIVRAPLNVKAMATSDSSVQVQKKVFHFLFLPDLFFVRTLVNLTFHFSSLIGRCGGSRFL